MSASIIGSNTYLAATVLMPMHSAQVPSLVSEEKKDKTAESLSELNPVKPSLEKAILTPSAAEVKENSDSPLSDAEFQSVIKQLKQRDQEVRVHEAAHLSSAGGLARGGMTFSFQTGPDGHRYAVGGEVNIEVAPGRTPEETEQKSQIIQRAALAPAEPSSQDYAVARAAAQMAMQARSELETKSADEGEPSQDGQEEREKNANLDKSGLRKVSHNAAPFAERSERHNLDESAQKVDVVQEGGWQRDLFMLRTNVVNRVR